MFPYLARKATASLIAVVAVISAVISAVMAAAPATYVGGRECAGCHAAEANAWKGSHHDLAMQVADEDTVLGDFTGGELDHFGITSTFFKRDGKFMVRTDGPGGQLREYEISYTFGFEPLQQYLIALPGGRYQALSIAWDSRPNEQGGQLWFHLYPDEKIRHDDPLHWTGIEQNWNSRCAACHSTDLRKNYDPDSDSFATTWSEMDVSCEACHGPGSRHVTWADRYRADTTREKGEGNGLLVNFSERVGVEWIMDAESGSAQRSRPRTSNVEIETCARCHARRARIWAEDRPDWPLLDTYLPRLLDPGMYHVDGQIQDEVYVYGSFIQSKMHRAGVTCSDCHEPHGLELRASGDGVCLQCHTQERYQSTGHHFHPADSAGAECVACHMPTRTYMVVDPRRDHSLRIPRPELSVRFATPNACTSCHVPRNASWAAEQVEKWYAGSRKGFQSYAPALDAARSGSPSAERLLATLANDPAAPSIARATALSALGSYLSPNSLEVAKRGLREKDPQLRVAAIAALEPLPPAARKPLLMPLLDDPVRAVRIQAAARLASLPLQDLEADERQRLSSRIEEYIAAQRVNAERPEAYLNLGVLYAEQGEHAKAEKAYRTALARQAGFVPAYVNLADHYLAQGKDDTGEAVLREGLGMSPESAQLHYALGLLLVRQKRLPEAVSSLERAAILDPAEAQYGYVYAIGLHTAGNVPEALRVLSQAHQRHPGNRAILLALVAYHRDEGDRDAAIEYARRLVVLDPRDPRARALLDALR